MLIAFFRISRSNSVSFNFFSSSWIFSCSGLSFNFPFPGKLDMQTKTGEKVKVIYIKSSFFSCNSTWQVFLFSGERGIRTKSPQPAFILYF
jgi:hypothetical protein